MTQVAPTVLLIACGALAKEIVALQKRNDWTHLKIQCLPPELHNRPDDIPAAVRDAIEEYRQEFEHIFVAYADCGTGGMLDKLLDEYGIERLPGAHCYDFFAGEAVFAELAEAEPGTFYLTDFLTRHFDRLVKKGLGLDKYPELMSVYFGNYRRLVYLSQVESPKLEALAESQAEYLGLEYEYRFTGLGNFENDIKEHTVQWLR